MDWNRVEVEKKESYTRAEIDEWDEIMRRRKAIYPACKRDGLQMLQSKGTLHVFESGAMRVQVALTPKPDGRMRIEGFSVPEGQEDEKVIVEALAESVKYAISLGGPIVYWYDASPEVESLDTRVYAAIAESMGATPREAGRFTVWEVAAG